MIALYTVGFTIHLLERLYGYCQSLVFGLPVTVGVRAGIEDGAVGENVWSEGLVHLLAN